MDWKPTESGTKALVQVLEHIQAPDTEAQQKGLEVLEGLQKHEEFAAYAGLLFCNPHLSKSIRMQAGILLKNYIAREKDSMNDRIFSVAKHYIQNAILDPSHEIRRTAANIVASIIRMSFESYQHSLGVEFNPNLLREVFEDWPTLMPDLIATLEKNAPRVSNNLELSYLIDGPLHVIELLLLDCGKAVSKLESTTNLFNALVYFARTQQYSPNTRNVALKSLYGLYNFQPDCMTTEIKKFCELIIGCMSECDESIRQTTVTLTIVTMNEFWNHFRESTPKVFKFMLEATNDANEEIAIEAGEFWNLYLTIDPRLIDMNYFVQFLNELCPVLIKRLRLTDELIAHFNLENDSQNQPDRAENVAPRHYRGSRGSRGSRRRARGARGARGASGADANGMNGMEADEDDSDFEDNMNQDDRDLGRTHLSHLSGTEWNIRRCCGRQMDMLASSNFLLTNAQNGTNINNNVDVNDPRQTGVRRYFLDAVFPLIKNFLNSSDVRNREAGVLALGTLVGRRQDYSGLEDSLDDILNYLNTTIQDENLLLRTMSCWTLSRYANMFVSALRLNHPSMSEAKLGIIIKVLLKRMLDESKLVQQAACGALATFCTHVSDRLHTWLDAILDTFMRAFEGYKLSSFPCLMDAATTVMNQLFLAESRHVAQCHRTLEMARMQNNEALAQAAQLRLQQLSQVSVLSNKVVDALVPPLMQRWVAFEKIEENGPNSSNTDANGSNNGSNASNSSSNGSNGSGDGMESSVGASDVGEEFLSNQYDCNIYPVFEGLTNFISIFGTTKYFQEKYMKEVFQKSLMLCVRVKQELREWNELKIEATKELLSVRSLSNANELTDEEEDNDITQNDMQNNNNNNNNNSNSSSNDSANDGNASRPSRRYLEGTRVIVDEKTVDDQVIEDFLDRDKPNVELWTCGLDILSVLCEKCVPHFEKVAFEGQNETLLLEMVWCGITTSEFYTVQRNSLALLGDMISNCSESMFAHCPQFLDNVIELIEPRGGHIATNASWTIGQALYKYQANMKDWSQKIVDQLRIILKDPDSQQFVLQNVAITMGRVIRVFPENLIENWSEFALEWIAAIEKFQQDKEKADVMGTLLEIVNVHPQGLQQQVNLETGVSALFKCMRRWQNPHALLVLNFARTVHNFYGALNADGTWNDLIQNRLDREVAQWALQMVQLHEQHQQRQQHQQAQQVQAHAG